MLFFQLFFVIRVEKYLIVDDLHLEEYLYIKILSFYYRFSVNFFLIILLL